MNGKYDVNKRTKRFVLLFSEYWREYDHSKRQRPYTEKYISSWHEYDTLEEAMEEISLIKEVYGDQICPEPYFDLDRCTFLEKGGDITNGGKWWGYLLLDYEKERAIKSGGHGYLDNYRIYSYSRYDKESETIRSNKDLKFLDKYFRKPGEVPEKYEWDDGEYGGWLQFRWGDGKNAIGYEEPEKPKVIKKKEDPMDIPVDDLDLEIEEIIRKKGWENY